MSAATYFRDSRVAFFAYVFVVSIFNCEPAPARNPALEASTSVIAAAPSDVHEETVAAPTSAADEKPLAPLPETDVKPVESEVGPPTRGDEVKDYLWSVYQRSGTKMDSHGDFTWKDSAAASVWGLSMEDYAVGGMDPDFRELLFAAGQAMDAAGIDWSILSGFRDDFRQSLAVGLRARGGNSFHGGSVATGGYGHGCAADLASSDGLSDDKVWSWLDRHGQQFGLRRPLRGSTKSPINIRHLTFHLESSPAGTELASGTTRLPSPAKSSSIAARSNQCGVSRAPLCHADAMQNILICMASSS
jgi:hypothetical protein